MASHEGQKKNDLITTPTEVSRQQQNIAISDETNLVCVDIYAY